MSGRKPKRGQRAPPPPAEDEWDLRYATKESLAFTEIKTQFSGTCAKAKARLKVAPTTRSAVQKPLRGTLAQRSVGGVQMQQWQFDISSGARLWYCVDPNRSIVWLTLAATGHPSATVAKGKRAPRNR